MSFLKQVFTWWNGQTLGTRFLTWRHGRKVGEDPLGNVYYQSADGGRRWVIFSGEAEASAVSPEWHGWLHHTWQDPPTMTPRQPREWERPHNPNMTGTEAAYLPPGSIIRPDPKPVRHDYEPWSPN
jgi:NADH:ubiquinone oxidoreductase subunit